MSDELNPYAAPTTSPTRVTNGTDVKPDWIFRPLASLAKPLKIALIIQALVILASGIHSASLAIRFQDKMTYDPLQTGDFEIIRALAGISFITFIITVVLWCMWTVRAHRNVRLMGARGMSISPGWAAGYFFIPIINLWRPYNAMGELDRASQEPSEWSTRERGGVIGGWWALFIISGIFSQSTASMTMRADTIDQLVGASWMEFVGSIIGLFSAILAIKVISRITGLQKEMEPASTL